MSVMSFNRGFCRVAYNAGVNPESLAKFAAAQSTNVVGSAAAPAPKAKGQWKERLRRGYNAARNAAGTAAIAGEAVRAVPGAPDSAKEVIGKATPWLWAISSLPEIKGKAPAAPAPAAPATAPAPKTPPVAPPVIGHWGALAPTGILRK